MSFLIKDKKLLITTIILVVFHIVGIIGIRSSYDEFFIHLSSFNLFLSFVLLLINQQQFNHSFFLFFIISFLTGYFVELIGINTKIIFGDYSYGNSLGIKLLDVPLIIGINWFILLYCAGCICNKIPVHFIIKSCIGSFLLVFLDVLIEPVAVELHFWSWQDNLIPYRNYVAWFIISFILLLIFNKLDFNKNNLFAKVLYSTQVLFFALLNLV